MDIKEAVNAGHVKTETKVVKVENPGDKANPLTQSYEYQEATDPEGMLILCGGDQSEVLARFNYAHDLKRRASVRQDILGKLEGPEKSIAKAAKGLVAAGLFDSEEEATEFVKAQRAAKGL